MSNWNSHTHLVGMGNDATTLENGLTVSYKVKHTITIQSLLRYLPKRNKSICLYNDLYANVHRRFICHCQKSGNRGQPRALVVKVSMLHFGSPGSTVPRHGSTPLTGGHAVAKHTKLYFKYV